MPDAVIYPANIKKDRDRLFACYSLNRQMIAEYNRQSAIASTDKKTYEAKFRQYVRTEFEPRVKQFLAEQNRLKEKIRKAAYSTEQWKEIGRLPDAEHDAVLLALYGDKRTEGQKSTLATSPLLGELEAIELETLSPLEGIDPTEDFSAYTEYDEDSSVSKTTNEITYTSADIRQKDYWVYADKGEDHFNGDFEHLFKFELTATDDYSPAAIWALSNHAASDVHVHEDNNYDYLSILSHRNSSDERIRLQEIDSVEGANTDDVVSALETQYFITVKRDEGVGTHGTLYAWVCTGNYYGESGSSLITDGDLALTLRTSKKDFQYIYGFAGHNDEAASAREQSGVVGYLDLQEGGATHEASATLTGAGTLAAAAHVTRYAAATLSGEGTLAAAGTVIAGAVYGSATLSGEGSLAAAGNVTRAGKATLSGEGTLSAGAVLIVVATATLSGEGALSAKGSFIILGSATLSGEGSLSAAGTIGISATLLAAQKSAQRLPYIEAQVYDYERGIKRLYYTRLYQGSEVDNHHGIAFDGQGSMHRVRAAATDKLYYQKVTNPGPTSDYSQWTEIASDCTGPCAIAAYGSKIYIFYRKTDDTLRKYYSHNYGQDWNSGELASYAGVLSMAAAWWGTGDIVLCFALKASQVNAITLDTSDQTTTPHTWSDDNHPWLTTYGIGATYNAFLNQCELVIAGKESDSPYNHHDLFRTKFDSTYTFLALESFLMSPDGEDITYQYPDCHLPAGAQPYETERVTAVEKFTGATPYTRPLTSHLVKGTTWSDTTFTEPRPFLNIAPSYGLRIATTAGYWWMEKPDGVWRAARAASSAIVLTTADPTGRILSLTQSVGEGLVPSHALVITLDNSKGQYNVGEGLVPSHINKRCEIALKLGYKTTQGKETLAAGTYWVDSWEHRSVSLRGESRSNLSTFTLFCIDGWGLMDRWTARYQMRWNKDDVDPRTVWQILYQVLARVGIQLTNSPPKPQSTAINNFDPDFVLDPGTGGDTALNRLLTFVPDRLAFRGQQAFTKNPLADEQSCYSYGPGPADHPVLAGSYAEQVTLSRSRSLGRDDQGDRILEEALDWDQLQLAIDELEQVYDPNLQTTTSAQERADAILRQASLRAQRASLVVPTNVAQELLDVVTVTDARCGINAQDHRVLAIRTDYELRNARYRQTLTLGAP